MKNAVIALSLLIATGAHAAPTVDEVGDPDSFGHSQIYLGSVVTPSITLDSDCTPDPNSPPAPEDRCIILNPQPATTSYDESMLGSLSLPANASRSLLCYSVSPNSVVTLVNLTDKRQVAEATETALITIRNAVLDDPRLIDRTTGLPFGGRISTSLSVVFEERTLDPGESDFKFARYSRTCINGFVSKRALVDRGLSEDQATQFFATPMQLSFGAKGIVRIVHDAIFGYSIRLYGDK